MSGLVGSFGIPVFSHGHLVNSLILWVHLRFLMSRCSQVCVRRCHELVFPIIIALLSPYYNLPELREHLQVNPEVSCWLFQAILVTSGFKFHDHFLLLQPSYLFIVGRGASCVGSTPCLSNPSLSLTKPTSFARSVTLFDTPNQFCFFSHSIPGHVVIQFVALIKLVKPWASSIPMLGMVIDPLVWLVVWNMNFIFPLILGF